MPRTRRDRFPRTEAGLRAYITRYFVEYDEFSRLFEAGAHVEQGPIPSELIFNLLDEGRDRDAWFLIAALVDAAPTQDALGFVAAGALEHLVHCSAASDGVYHQIVERARANAKLREALGMMYWRGEPVWFRSEMAALGVRIISAGPPEASRPPGPISF